MPIHPRLRFNSAKLTNQSQFQFIEGKKASQFRKRCRFRKVPLSETSATLNGEIGGRPNLADLMASLKGLPQFVGYSDIVKATGVSRSTIFRAWRGPWKEGESRLPPPRKIGSRSVWTVDEVTQWLLFRR